MPPDATAGAAGTAAAPPSSRARLVYRLALGVAVLTAAVALAFFLIGIGDGSVSSFNVGLWLGLLATMAASLVGGRWLFRRGRTVLAVAALAVTALPGLAAGGFMLLLLLLPGRWN